MRFNALAARTRSTGRRDTHLNRTAAIKIYPVQLSSYLLAVTPL